MDVVGVGINTVKRQGANFCRAIRAAGYDLSLCHLTKSESDLTKSEFANVTDTRISSLESEVGQTISTPKRKGRSKG